MKKIQLATAGAALVLAVTLAGCSAPGAGTATSSTTGSAITAKVTPASVAKLGKVTLKMWADQAEEPLMKDVIPAYEALYPNVTVNITYKSFDDLIATVVNAAASASPPDLFEGNIGYSVDGALVKGKLVRSLDDVAKVYGWTTGTGASTLTPAMWNTAGTSFGSGTLYGMSPISEMQGIYYNTAKLKALGLTPPTTIAELQADLPIAAAAGQQPIMLGNSDQYAATHIFSDIAVTNQSAASIRNWNDGKAGSTFVTAGNKKTAETMKEWATKGYFGAGYDGLSNEDAIAKFAAGSGVFFVGGSWNGASLTSPQFGLSSLVSGGSGATASPWHISSKTKVAPAAIAFLTMLHSPKVGQQILDTGRLPVVSDGVQAKDALQEQTFKALKATIAAGTQTGYYDFASSDMLTVLGGSLQEIMAGRTSSTDFVTTVQAAWTKAHPKP
jgi:raffinose/stachyose/melibiose transport system substrate-binding protein